MLFLKQRLHRDLAVDLLEVVLVLQGRVGREQGRENGLFCLGGLLENGFPESQLCGGLFRMELHGQRYPILSRIA
jgi:hypothetical protein